MKKWMYVISVGSMLAIFLLFYLSATKQREAKERQRAIDVAKKKADEEARKAGIEAKAKADADERAAKRAADEAKKDADRVAKWDAEGQKIKDATDKANALADESAKKAAQLELQLTSLRAQKEKLNRDAFELAKEVELGKINRRTAEMEIQRITTIIANKASQSILARPPALTPPSS